MIRDAEVLEKSVNDETVDLALQRLKASLLRKFDIAELFARDRVAHKWKATFRSLLVREAVFWRLEDLLQQSYVLHKMGHALGALILLRCALETLAMLIYLNQLTAKVVDGSLDFFASPGHQHSDDFTKVCEAIRFHRGLLR